MISDYLAKLATVILFLCSTIAFSQEYKHYYKNNINKHGAYLNTIVFQGMMIGKGYDVFRRTFVHPLKFEAVYKGTTGNNTEYCTVSYDFQETYVTVHLKRSVYQNFKTYEVYPNKSVEGGEKLYKLHHEFFIDNYLIYVDSTDFF